MSTTVINLTTMTSAITITYELNPPAGVDTKGKDTSSTLTFPVSGGTTPREFYGGLRAALEQARTQVGDELTEWRDLVGKAELGKEPKGKAKNGDVEGDEDDDESEEA